MRSTWTAICENNEIRIENTWFNGERLYVNGNLQDEKFSMFSSCLTGHIINLRNEKEKIKVNIGGLLEIYCRLFINDKKIELMKNK